MRGRGQIFVSEGDGRNDSIKQQQESELCRDNEEMMRGKVR